MFTFTKYEDYQLASSSLLAGMVLCTCMCEKGLWAYYISARVQ